MAQTIRHIDEQNLYNKIDLLYIKMSEKYHMKNKFEVGGGYNRKDFVILQRLQKMLCSCGKLDECEVEYINKIIDGLR